MTLSLSTLIYICEEVRRQGHDLAQSGDGGVRVAGMVRAWEAAQSAFAEEDSPPTITTIRAFGADIESRNKSGFRTCAITVGGRPAGADARLIQSRLEALLEAWPSLAPLEVYRAFEDIHPFVDGNGRTGKILLNWRNGTLAAPIFPPKNFWGWPIQNP